jgi:hypothetical protein
MFGVISYFWSGSCRFTGRNLHGAISMASITQSCFTLASESNAQSMAHWTIHRLPKKEFSTSTELYSASVVGQNDWICARDYGGSSHFTDFETTAAWDCMVWSVVSMDVQWTISEFFLAGVFCNVVHFHVYYFIKNKISLLWICHYKEVSLRQWLILLQQYFFYIRSRNVCS